MVSVVARVLQGLAVLKEAVRVAPVEVAATAEVAVTVAAAVDVEATVVAVLAAAKDLEPRHIRIPSPHAHVIEGEVDATADAAATKGERRCA